MEANQKIIASALTWEDKKAWCEAWKKTDLSRSEFIRQHKLPNAFHYWCNKLWPKESNLTVKQEHLFNKEDWVQIIPKTSAAMNLCGAEKAAPADMMELKLLLNGIKLNFCLPMVQMVNFIRELSDAVAIIR